ncbi:hypothetical protein PG985_004343 [Apiospora marii]|uniref:Uncharacterized protein n=1 Tax=Apiospora marii TaxID=335849 RepID=A0ABR1S902_9PEZI
MPGHQKVRMSELEALQRPFYVDPGINKIGATGRRTRNSRVSKAAAASAKTAGITTGVRRKWKAAIKKFSKPQPGYPRFLFRGIRPNSGGGAEVSEKLNTTEGVVPHAFTSGDDYDLFDTPNLRQVVNAHLSGSHAGNSPFSSWTPSMGIAMKYTTEDGRLAMLDTTLLNNRESPESAPPLSDPALVFHVPDLVETEMAGVEDDWEWDYEFLVYRPVTRPAFRSVAVGEIRDAGWGYKHDHGTKGDNLEVDGLPHPVREEDVVVARAVAELYRLQDAARNNSPAVALNATAAFLSVKHRRKGELDDADLQVLTRQLAADLAAWRASGDEALLVNPQQFTKGMLDSKFMVRMLVDIQKQPPLKQPEPVRESAPVPEPVPEPVSEPLPEPLSEPVPKSKKRKADDDDDLQPPSPKRQRIVKKAEPVRGRPRTRAPRKKSIAQTLAERSASDPDL